MSAKAFLGLACVLALPLSGQAHMNPHGDINPSVEVEDGKFSIHFITRVETETLNWGMAFSPEGKLVLPRHRISVKSEEQPASADAINVETREEPRSDKTRFVLTRTTGGQKVEHLLPLDPVKFAFVAQSTVAGEWAGFTWIALGGYDWAQDGSVNPSDSMNLMFSAAATQGFAPGKTVLIGEPAMINYSPSASAPVWAAHRWWVAWVRQAETEAERKDPLRAWETILTSIDPVTGKLQNKRLPGISSWNTPVSMKTTGGWLCIAWNASIDGSYPGTAKIVTAFEKLPEG
jgi:hypothetical protein